MNNYNIVKCLRVTWCKCLLTLNLWLLVIIIFVVNKRWPSNEYIHWGKPRSLRFSEILSVFFLITTIYSSNSEFLSSSLNLFCFVVNCFSCFQTVWIVSLSRFFSVSFQMLNRKFIGILLSSLPPSLLLFISVTLLFFFFFFFFVYFGLPPLPPPPFGPPYFYQ